MPPKRVNLHHVAWTLFFLGTVWLNLGNVGLADSSTPSLYLGMPSQLMVQPYVSVEVLNETSPGVYESFGPTSEPEYMEIYGITIPISSAHNSLLLDTGANSILIVDVAAQDLEDAGYQTEGTFWEIGVGGYTEYDVSAAYRFAFAGSDGVVHYLDGANGQGVRIQSNPDSVLAAPLDQGGIAGLVGMPAMTGRVTTLDVAQNGGLPNTPIEEMDIWELIALLSGGTSITTTFSNDLTPGSTNRYTVALDNRIHFSAEEGLPDGAPVDSPLPEYADVPFLTAKVNSMGVDGIFREKEGTFLLDTGAQFSMISRRMAFALGLDENGDGSLNDQALDFIEVTGVGGTKSVPILCIDEFRLPTEQGVDIVWNDPSDPAERLGVQVIVMDLFPCADINFDGIVDDDDIGIIENHANLGLVVQPGDIPSGDINSDGIVDGADLLIAQGQFGESIFIDGIFGIDMLTSGSSLNSETYEFVGTSFFDKVHFDFRDWANGNGTLVLDVNLEYNTIVSPQIPGDANGDGKVDGSDVTILAGNWQATVTGGAAMGDFNGDGKVDGSDVTILAGNWQYGVTSATAAVPEPSVWILLVMLGLLGFLKHACKNLLPRNS